jgi:anti-sigma regulatory factor (Ser/Thr protein kinase)
VAGRVLRSEPAAVGEARKHIRDRLAETLPTLKLTDAELLTSELVSNAVRHARPENGSPIEVFVVIRSDAIRVSIVDEGPGFGRTERPVDQEIGGWGLHIVEHVADRWGVEEHPHTVWFEIDR